jgi:DNA (cytosine-5)-methyltransferase 1
VDNTKEHINHLSLCSGYEGIGTGLRRVLPNLREIAYVEREGFVAANLVAKMEEGRLDAAPVFTDVKTFPYRKFRGCVDILSGGFPCQPFSQAGVRKGTEDPRHLFPYIRDGIRECQPGIVFLENVEGIISSKMPDGESVLQYVLRELEGLGYIATAGVFSASEVGAPHQRKRVFILGYSKHNGPYGSEESRGITATVRNIPQGTDATSQPSGAGASTELADGNNEGLEGHERHGSTEPSEPIQADTWTEGSTRWPARPSQPQYDWEEPRVVADTKSQQGASGNHGSESGATCEPREGEPRGGCSGSLRESNGQAESKLGRATNGSTSRVDRLRLLGNGVVPATAAKAFVTLIQRVV